MRDRGCRLTPVAMPPPRLLTGMMVGIEDDQLRRLIRSELAGTVDAVGRRSIAQREDAQRQLDAAERLRVEMRQLLEAAHESLREVRLGLETVEHRYARESRDRAGILQDLASDAHDSGRDARARSNAARDRADTMATMTGDRLQRERRNGGSATSSAADPRANGSRESG